MVSFFMCLLFSFLQEFYTPMRTAGLLTVEQLQLVFSNLDELITINDRFADQLLDALETAVDAGKPVSNKYHVSTLRSLLFYCI